MTSRAWIIGGVVLTAGVGLASGCRPSPPHPKDAATEVDRCLRWGITSESGEGWTIGKDMCLDVYPPPEAMSGTSGVAGGGVCPASTSPSSTVQLSAESPPFGTAEGRIAHCLVVKDKPGGMALRLLAPQDMSRFAGGRLVFDLAADNTDRLQVGIRWNTADAKLLPLAGRVVGVSKTTWTKVSIPLADFGANLAVLIHPFELTAQIGLGDSRSFCVDDLHFEASSCVADGVLPIDAREVGTGPDVTNEGGVSPDGKACLGQWVPSTCVSAGTNLDQLLFGILLECKPDVFLDQPGDAKIGWSGSSPTSGSILSATDPRRPTSPVEGSDMLCATVNQGSGSTFVYYDTPHDFRVFQGGYLETELYADADVLIGLSWRAPGASSESRSSVQAARYAQPSATSGWRSVRIPLCEFGADLSSLIAVASFTVNGSTSPTAFCADAIRFRKPTSSCNDSCTSLDGSVDSAVAKDIGLPSNADAKDTSGGESGASCLATTVPDACLPPGTTADQLVYGILLECKQDVRIDEAGGAKIGWWNGTSSSGAILSPADPKPTSPAEGTDMLCATVNQGSGSVFVYYDSPRDFSTFQDGYLELQLFADADVRVGLSWESPGATSESSSSVRAAEHTLLAATSGWKSIRIPLCLFQADLTSLVSVAAFSIEGRTSPTTFCVDAVRYRKATSSCSDKCLPDAGADSPGGRDAAPPVDAHAVADADAAVERDAVDGPFVHPDAGYLATAVPAACMPSGETADQLVYGILLESKQDVRIDEAGEAKVGWWLGSSSSGSILSPSDSKPTSPVEGTDMLCATVAQGSGSAFVYYDSPHSYIDYRNGYLELELFAATDADVLVGLSWKSPGATSELRKTVRAADYAAPSATNGWKSIRIPLCVFGADLTSLVSIAAFSVDGRASPATFCVDAVRYRKATSTCSDECSARAAESSDAAIPNVADAPSPASADAAAATATLDGGSCLTSLLPGQCIPAGETADPLIYGVLLDCKQDVILDQPGEAHVGWWESGLGIGGILSPQAAKPTLPFEGSNMICATIKGGSGSFFVYYDSPRDFSAYQNGYLEAELLTDSPGVQMGLSWLEPGVGGGEYQGAVAAANYAITSSNGGWMSVRIPLCAFAADLAHLKAIASFSLTNYGSPATYCVDAVRFRKATASCTGCCTGC